MTATSCYQGKHLLLAPSIVFGSRNRVPRRTILFINKFLLASDSLTSGRGKKSRKNLNHIQKKLQNVSSGRNAGGERYS